MKKLSFVIPCYGSEKSIGGVVSDIQSTVIEHGGYDYEIICVNDKSPDKVIDVLRSISGINKKVKVLSLAKNSGQHAAIMAGYSVVSGDIIVCLDDDGQNPPSEMFKLIDEVENGKDIVFAKYSVKKHSIFRNFGSVINNVMAEQFIGKPKDFALTSYFACKRYIVDEILKYDKPYPYLGGLLLRTTDNIGTVPVTHKERAVGKSGYSINKLLSLWMNGFTAFSVKPLRVASISGAISASAGFIYGVIAIIRKVVEPEKYLAGYSSIICILLFLGGLTLLVLGLIGEYIGRIYICINRSPQYVICEKINLDEDQQIKNS